MKSRHTVKTTTRPAKKSGGGQLPRKPVEFSLKIPQAQFVAIAGTFNDWDPKRTPMHKTAEGTWRSTLSLGPGHYEYRFVIDGEWRNDPKATASVGNPFGSTNSVLIVRPE